MPDRKCNTCKRVYSYKPCHEGKTKWCSRKCRYNQPKPVNTCIICSRAFIPRIRKDQKTCSKKCLSVHSKRRYEALRVTVTCENTDCRKEFKLPRAQAATAKTCSKKCQASYLSKRYIGRKLPPDWVANQNKAKIASKIRKYGDYSCQLCGKQFKSNTSLRAHAASCGKQQPTECDICNKRFKSSAAMKNHRHYHSQEFLKMKGASIREGIRDSEYVVPSTSKAELAFFEDLKDIYGDDVIHKFKVKDYYHEYDFYIKSSNTIVEFDGDYWHGNKDMYIVTERMKEQWEKDTAHNEKAMEHGYNIERVWQSESKKWLGVMRESACSTLK